MNPHERDPPPVEGVVLRHGLIFERPLKRRMAAGADPYLSEVLLRAPGLGVGLAEVPELGLVIESDIN